MSTVNMHMTFRHTNPNVTLDTYNIRVDNLEFRIELNGKLCYLPFSFNTSHIQTNGDKFEFISENGLSDSYTNIYEKLGIKPQDITAKLLSSIDPYDIKQFSIVLQPKKGKETNIGSWIIDSVHFEENGNTFELTTDCLEYLNKELFYMKGCSSCDKANCNHCTTYSSWQYGTLRESIPKCEVLYQVTPEARQIINTTLEHIRNMQWSVHANPNDIDKVRHVYDYLLTVEDMINLNNSAFLDTCPTHIVVPDFECLGICTTPDNAMKGYEYQLECWRLALHLAVPIYEPKFKG